jgi:hypothetical protein
MNLKPFTAAVMITACVAALASETHAPKPDLLFTEDDGLLSVEAEYYYKQTLATKRAWHVASQERTPDIKPDPDPSHLPGASGGAYVEILPDSRVTHDDPLIDGENFSSEPGKMGVLHYKAHFKNPGRYYVWVRVFSTGTEDNGIHVGLNGEWPASGQRWQTVKKHAWAWDSRQRTDEVHSGVPLQLYLDVTKPGENEIMFSMREDGFAMDKFILSSNREFVPDEN